MKLSSPSISVLFALGLGYKLAIADKQQSATIQSRLVDKCCQVGKERAIESSKFNCKLSAREALIGSGSQRNFMGLTAESMLARDPSFADQCEMVLESCCMAHHRSKNCDSGKQFAKSGATCMDVELSKEATIATESFNDCCMSCSLGILAARNPAQNETTSSSGFTRSNPNLSNRCKLISPLASSLSGQLYEQTYVECCQENLPTKPSGALLEPGAPIDCGQYNPCSQRCVSATSSFELGNSNGRRFDQDRCDCFAGYKLSNDGVTCVDIDECKLGQHTCNRQSEICDNTRGSFRCLARVNNNARSSSIQLDNSFDLNGAVNDNGELAIGAFSSKRLCPLGMRWDSIEGKCQTINGDGIQRSASLSSLRLSEAPSSSLSDLRLFDN